jgi:PKD repeat protein
VNDGKVDSNIATVSITIIPVNDVPIVNAGLDATINEGSAFIGSGSFVDPDNNTWTATVNYGDGTGTQQVSLTDKTFALSHVYADNGTYTVTITVNDGTASGADTLTITVNNIAPAVTAESEQTINEGDTASFSGSFTDPGADLHLIAWDFGDGTSSTGTLTTSHTYADNGTYTATLTVTDDDGGIGTDTVTVTVNNVAPTVGPITAPIDPVRDGTEITVSAPFTDPGTIDTHTATWNWGDGTASVGTITEAGGSGTVQDTHIYAQAGVYTITLTVTDKDGASGSAVFQYVVVYDPDGGFVTGGGWINSPAGAYVPNPSLIGKATFGFVSKYKKGANVPTGNTEFQFKVANLNFHSESYQWLVVAGAKAQYKGTGTINGNGNYGFILTAIDGDLKGTTDKFRIKIWDKDNNDTIVYDNLLAAPDDSDPTTVIGGGSIVIHKQ